MMLTLLLSSFSPKLSDYFAPNSWSHFHSVILGITAAPIIFQVSTLFADKLIDILGNKVALPQGKTDKPIDIKQALEGRVDIFKFENGNTTGTSKLVLEKNLLKFTVQQFKNPEVQGITPNILYQELTDIQVVAKSILWQEFFFRGFIPGLAEESSQFDPQGVVFFSSMPAKITKKVIAILYSSYIFGGAHQRKKFSRNQNIFNCGFQVMAGLFYSILKQSSGNILASLAARVGVTAMMAYSMRQIISNQS